MKIGFGEHVHCRIGQRIFPRGVVEKDLSLRLARPAEIELRQEPHAWAHRYFAEDADLHTGQFREAADRVLFALPGSTRQLARFARQLQRGAEVFAGQRDMIQGDLRWVGERPPKPIFPRLNLGF